MNSNIAETFTGCTLKKPRVISLSDGYKIRVYGYFNLPGSGGVTLYFQPVERVLNNDGEWTIPDKYKTYANKEAMWDAKKYKHWIYGLEKNRAYEGVVGYAWFCRERQREKLDEIPT